MHRSEAFSQIVSRHCITPSLRKQLSRLNRTAMITLMGMLALSPAAVVRAAQPIFEGNDGWLFPEWENITVFDKANIDASIALLRQAKDLFARRQIDLVFVVVPTKALFYPSKLPADRVVSPEVRDRYNYILQAMGQAGLKAPNMAPVLRSVEQGQQTAYYRTDYHWTSMGAEAAASAAATRIIANGVVLKGKSGTGTALGEWANERHYGDLATRYLPPARRATIGRDIFKVRLPPSANASLFDEDPAPVHVMGNSFVQPYWGFSQKLSNLLDRPVSLTWNAGNVGQWVISLTYVESKDFADNKPQVIVWQMNESQIQLGPQDAGLWDVQGLMQPQVWLGRLKTAIEK